MEILVIVIAVLLLGFLCMKGMPTIVSGIFCSVLVMLCFGTGIYEGLKETYMSGFISFVKSWFLLFLFGGLLGRVMDASGAADSLANAILKLVGQKRITLGLTIVGFIFTAAGITPYVTMFIVIPLGLKMCQKANLPRGFSFAGFIFGNTIALGTPFFPVANNILCTGFFETTASAGGVIAIICNIAFFVIGYLYLCWYEKRCRSKNMGFIATEKELAEGSLADNANGGRPHWVLGLIPLLCPIIALNFLKWTVEWSLLSGAVVAIVLQIKYLPHKYDEIRAQLARIISDTSTTVINTSAVVGFGTVVTASVGYQIAVEKILSIQADPLVMAFICTGLLAGVAGSSSSGIILAAPVLQNFATAANAEFIHRTVIYGSLSLDTLPNCGYLHGKAAVAGVSLKETYIPIDFMLSVVLPTVAGILYILIVKIAGLA